MRINIKFSSYLYRVRTYGGSVQMVSGSASHASVQASNPYDQPV
jgi:hypothetical protein